MEKTQTRTEDPRKLNHRKPGFQYWKSQCIVETGSGKSHQWILTLGETLLGSRYLPGLMCFPIGGLGLLVAREKYSIYKGTGRQHLDQDQN